MSSVQSSTVIKTFQARVSAKRSPWTLIRWLLFGTSRHSLLPFIPRSLKLLIAFIFLMNWRSWPLLWHYRFLKPVFKIELVKAVKARSPEKRRKWLDRICCVGGNPFELVSKISCYAGIDDIDINGHLSNSSYAKACDGGRMQAPVDILPCLFTDGCWAALGQTCYNFIREIPYGTHYDVLTTIGAWDEKWMYLFHYFVSYPERITFTGRRRPTRRNSLLAVDSSGFAHQRIPGTPSLIDSPPIPGSPAFKPRDSPDRTPGTIPHHKIKTPLPLGTVVHCVAISSYCFKIGRITVPPAVMFVASGLGDPSKERWTRVQDLRFAKTRDGYVENKLKNIFRGGWKTDTVEGWDAGVDEASKFWRLEEYEERRLENMDLVFDGLHDSFKNMRNRKY